MVNLIQYLDMRHGKRFFITPRDFDILYRWWEKGVPIPLVCRTIDAVIERRSRKNKEIGGFSVFSYQVRKDYEEFLQIKSQDERRAEDDVRCREIDEFLENIPLPLQSLEGEIRRYFQAVKNNKDPDVSSIEENLLELFQSDPELETRTDAFMSSLAPSLRKDELKRRYRINYILRKWRIPV